MWHSTIGILAVSSFLLMSSACAAGLDGNYQAAEDPAITLTLHESAGVVDGTLSDGGIQMSLSGTRQGNAITGTAYASGVALPFSAQSRNNQLLLMVRAPDESQQYTFARVGSAAAGVKAQARAARRVIINDHRLTDAELAAIAQQYGVNLPDADYWYDPVLGAWGLKGGPTRGFTSAGLQLGGPLQANASGGGSQIFINGRELDPQDAMALQMLTQTLIPPGRYFITAQGLAGLEGGAPLWNLAALGRQSQGGGNNWHSNLTGAGGLSNDDNSVGAVFLPGGGSVSYDHSN